MLRPSILKKNYIDTMFDDFFGNQFWGTTGMRAVSAMNTDITESNQSYEIEMELPGFTKEDISADLKEGYLTIRAAHSEEKEDCDDDKKYIRRERYSGHYERRFYVGDAVKEEDIKARFKEGILTMEIPKNQEQPEVEEKKHISIEG